MLIPVSRGNYQRNSLSLRGNRKKHNDAQKERGEADRLGSRAGVALRPCKGASERAKGGLASGFCRPIRRSRHACLGKSRSDCYAGIRKREGTGDNACETERASGGEISSARKKPEMLEKLGGLRGRARRLASEVENGFEVVNFIKVILGARTRSFGLIKVHR